MINQDRMIFRRFLRQFLTGFLQILRRPLSIQILTALKMSQNYIGGGWRSCSPTQGQYQDEQGEIIFISDF